MRVTVTKMEVSRYTQRQECNVRNENNNRYNVVKTKKGKGPGYEIDTEMKIEQTMKKTVLIKLLI